MFLEYFKVQKVILAYLDIVNNVENYSGNLFKRLFLVHENKHLQVYFSTSSMQTKIPSHLVEQWTWIFRKIPIKIFNKDFNPL